jgi:tetratricopeptide (TPR) repeat protein
MADAAPPKVPALLARAVAGHCAGQLAEAESLYRAILAQQPRHADANHNLGLLLVSAGQPQAALPFLKTAVEAMPKNVTFWQSQIQGLIAANRRDLAEQAIRLGQRRGIAPKFVREAEALLGRTATPGPSAEAASPAQAARDEESLIAFFRAGQHAAVVEHARRFTAVHPQHPFAWKFLSASLQLLGRQAEAAAAARQAVATAPSDPEAANNLGLILASLKDLAGAEAAFRRAAALNADYADAFSNLGGVLHQQKRSGEAEPFLRRAFALEPLKVETLNNLGGALLALERTSEALTYLDEAIRLNPSHHESHYNRGLALLRTDRRAALACFDQTLILQPDHVPSRLHKALLLLLAGDFAAGWPLYEVRWSSKAQREYARSFPVPQWDGAESLDGRVILLHAEQGYGDTIQFCRYAELVAARGARVLLEVPRRLHGLLQGLPGVSQLLVQGEPLPGFDFHIPLLSLPLAFGTTLASIPAHPRYLTASPAKRAKWEKLLGPKTKPRAGLVWSGSASHEADRYRSMSLTAFAPHLPKGWDYFSLQKEVRPADQPVLQAHPEIRPLHPAHEDFTDDAAIIELLDVVVTVDTSVAHLSGALGRPTWILLSHHPDWRWLLGRDDSPWYPSARLFRQTVPDHWTAPLERVRDELERLTSAGHRS